MLNTAVTKNMNLKIQLSTSTGQGIQGFFLAPKALGLQAIASSNTPKKFCPIRDFVHKRLYVTLIEFFETQTDNQYFSISSFGFICTTKSCLQYWYF